MRIKNYVSKVLKYKIILLVLSSLYISFVSGEGKEISDIQNHLSDCENYSSNETGKKKVIKKLICMCGSKNSKGEYNLVNKEQLQSYLAILNADEFSKYAIDCDGIFNVYERNFIKIDTLKSVEDLVKGLELDLEKSKNRTDDLAKSRWKKDAKDGLISIDEAMKIVSRPATGTSLLTLSFSDSNDNTSDTTSYGFGYKWTEKEWKNFVPHLHSYINFEIKGGRKETKTNIQKTVVESADLILGSFSPATKNEPSQFKYSIGAGRLWTKKLDLSNFIQTKEKDFAAVHIFSWEVQLKKGLYKFGIQYELKTKHLFKDKLASNLAPTFSIDFLKIGSE